MKIFIGILLATTFNFLMGFRDLLGIDNLRGNFGIGGEYVEEKDLDLVISGGEIDIEAFGK